jgi:protein arginine kinase activator
MSERPLECCECRKETCIRFVQVTLDQMNEYTVCRDCPMITKWCGFVESSKESSQLVQGAGDICCGHCGTTMENVLVGSPLGCADCYDVFADVLCTQILKIPFSNVIHCGRGPGESAIFNPTLRLYALNEALQETLSREEYEEAARIRDEINALIQTNDPVQDPSSSQEGHGHAPAS